MLQQKSNNRRATKDYLDSPIRKKPRIKASIVDSAGEFNMLDSVNSLKSKSHTAEHEARSELSTNHQRKKSRPDFIVPSLPQTAESVAPSLKPKRSRKRISVRKISLAEINNDQQGHILAQSISPKV
jgi:hypothetical protein